MILLDIQAGSNKVKIKLDEEIGPIPYYEISLVRAVLEEIFQETGLENQQIDIVLKVLNDNIGAYYIEFLKARFFYGLIFGPVRVQPFAYLNSVFNFLPVLISQTRNNQPDGAAPENLKIDIGDIINPSYWRRGKHI